MIDTQLPLPSGLEHALKLNAVVKAELLRRSFRKFIRWAWPIVEPATPLRENWHIDAIADHLQAVSEGQIQKLVINIPPGHLKSLEACVFWPAWIWTWRPSYRGLFCSYSGDLALRDSVRCRLIVESPQYRALFTADHKTGQPFWQLDSDQNTKGYFKNSKTGERMALSVGGKGTGFRGNLVLVDDPINATEAPSKIVRDAAIQWWDISMSNRINDPAKDAFVIIQQRLHEDDLAGHALAQGGYEHLMLPSEYDPKRATVTSLGTPDPRKESGELLFPTMFTEEVLKEAKIRLGSDGYAGQHDQLPTPPGGGMFKKKWWRFWRWREDAPFGGERPKGCNEYPTKLIQKLAWKWDSVVMSVDCTFKSVEASKGKDPDYVVITVWGCKDADRFLLYRFRKRAGFGATCDAIREAVREFPNAYRKLVEDKANGSAVIETLQGEISGIIAVDPEGGKEARANAVAPQVESGNVYLPESAPWLDEWVGEFASFPRGKHDDQVDSMTQALIDRMQGKANRLKMLVRGM